MWRELTPNVQAFLSMPEGVTVEVMENKTLATPVAFHHIHESVVDGEAARAWYMKEFGAGSGSRRNLPAAMFPGGEVDFLKAQMPPEPTKGHALDHIGFEVKDLDAFMKKMAADGVTINMPSTRYDGADRVEDRVHHGPERDLYRDHAGAGFEVITSGEPYGNIARKVPRFVFAGAVLPKKSTTRWKQRPTAMP